MSSIVGTRDTKKYFIERELSIGTTDAFRAQKDFSCVVLTFKRNSMDRHESYHNFAFTQATTSTALREASKTDSVTLSCFDPKGSLGRQRVGIFSTRDSSEQFDRDGDSKVVAVKAEFFERSSSTHKTLVSTSTRTIPTEQTWNITTFFDYSDGQYSMKFRDRRGNVV